MSSEALLRGLRILDAGTMVAGPFAGTLAADYGADVIKIEQPGVGDAVRSLGPFKEGISLWWKVNGRNKRLVTLNLSQPRGRELFLRLVERSDVVVENYRPGMFASWGLSYEELAAVNPRIIVVHVSGYGQDGPYAHRAGYGTVAEAISGVPYSTGWPDRPPTLSSFALADTTTALFALIGLLGAVYERDIAGSGRGQEVDVALYEPLFRLSETQVIGYDQLGIVRERRGNRLDEGAPRNTFRTGDGHWVAVVASNDRTFARLAAAIGQPELADDPRFRDNPSRVANDGELDRIVGDWIAGQTLAEALEIFDRGDVVAGPVNSIADIFADPLFRVRGNIVAVPDEDFGEVLMPGVVPIFSRSSCEVRNAGGALGADTDEVLSELLGLGEDELGELRESGTI